MPNASRLNLAHLRKRLHQLCAEANAYCATGPLDSLVYYSTLQLASGFSDQDRVRRDIDRWLSRLERVDPFRHRRYSELRKCSIELTRRNLADKPID